MGIISCSTGIGSSLSINYALDSYKDMSGEVMMAVILVRVSTPTRHFLHSFWIWVFECRIPFRLQL
jgi:hypothetical protein